MKSYTKRQNGKRMRTRHIKIHIDEEMTKLIMERAGVGQMEAESKIISAMLYDSPYPVVGMGIDEHGNIIPAEQQKCDEFEPPIVTGY